MPKKIAHHTYGGMKMALKKSEHTMTIDSTSSAAAHDLETGGIGGA